MELTGKTASGWRWLQDLAGDLRFGARMLRKNPGFTAVAVLTLAMGIGANTTIFSVVNAALLRSLPFPHTSRIVYISSRSTLFDFPNMGVSLPDIDDLRTGAKSFEAVAAYRTARKELAGDGQPERIESAEISPDMLPILGIRPLYGRGFTSSDMQPGTRAVMIGYSLWRDRFGSDPNAVGKTLMVDGQLRSVIGVLPSEPRLDFVTDCQLWAPFIPSQEELADRGNHGFSVLEFFLAGNKGSP